MLRFRRLSPKKDPLFFVGLLVLCIANFLRWCLPRTALLGHMGADALDGLLGFFYGIAIGVLLLHLWRSARRGRSCTTA